MILQFELLTEMNPPADTAEAFADYCCELRRARKKLYPICVKVEDAYGIYPKVRTAKK